MYRRGSIRILHTCAYKSKFHFPQPRVKRSKPFTFSVIAFEYTVSSFHSSIFPFRTCRKTNNFLSKGRKKNWGLHEAYYCTLQSEEILPSIMYYCHPTIWSEKKHQAKGKYLLMKLIGKLFHWKSPSKHRISRVLYVNVLKCFRKIPLIVLVNAGVVVIRSCTLCKMVLLGAVEKGEQ